MAEDKDRVIRVTAEDLASAVMTPTETAASVGQSASSAGGPRSYGNINSAATTAEPVPTERPSFLLQGWFYLGAAGLLGAVSGWGICEHAFVDGGMRQRWGNIWLLPLVIMLMLVYFAIAESLVERSWKKAAIRLVKVVPLGLIFGFVFDGAANIVYGIALGAVHALGVENERNPGWWLARALAWAVFGVAAGLIYGLVGKSSKKAKYGVAGGSIGAFIGGLAFDPIAIMLNNAAQSRAFGFAMLGLVSGAAMGFVESALKDRWLYVSAGPLAGKQFILYKSSTAIGSDQGSDIYLFKDPSIAPKHAVIEIKGSQTSLRAAGPVFISGIPVQARVLSSGDYVQIGRYSFQYNERHR